MAGFQGFKGWESGGFKVKVHNSRFKKRSAELHHGSRRSLSTSIGAGSVSVSSASSLGCFAFALGFLACLRFHASFAILLASSKASSCSSVRNLTMPVLKSASSCARAAAVSSRAFRFAAALLRGFDPKAGSRLFPSVTVFMVLSSGRGCCAGGS